MPTENHSDESVGALILGAAAVSFAGLLAAVAIEKVDPNLNSAIRAFAAAIPVGVFGYGICTLASSSPFRRFLVLFASGIGNIAWLFSIAGIHSLFQHLSEKAASDFLLLAVSGYVCFVLVYLVGEIMKQNKRKTNKSLGKPEARDKGGT